jgi:ferredoxin/flavodoxin---NADP+ reductase
VSFDKNYAVAVIGAGPAGLYAAQYLARQGMQVVIFNRDIKPGGLAEYGIFPDKTKMRSGLLAQFKRILTMPLVRYQGNVVVGQSGDFHLDQLRAAGFRAFMVTTGA